MCPLMLGQDSEAAQADLSRASSPKVGAAPIGGGGRDCPLPLVHTGMSGIPGIIILLDGAGFLRSPDGTPNTALRYVVSDLHTPL
jgi:hypothetical protein